MLILVTFLFTAVTHYLLELVYRRGTWHGRWDMNPELAVMA